MLELPNNFICLHVGVVLDNVYNVTCMYFFFQQYDFYLERRAAEWSEQCHWGHQEKGLGENLAMFWSTGQQMSIAEIIVQSHQNWWNEIHSWSWDTSCGNACHYTQVLSCQPRLTVTEYFVYNCLVKK